MFYFAICRKLSREGVVLVSYSGTSWGYNWNWVDVAEQTHKKRTKRWPSYSITPSWQRAGCNFCVEFWFPKSNYIVCSLDAWWILLISKWKKGRYTDIFFYWRIGVGIIFQGKKTNFP